MSMLAANDPFGFSSEGYIAASAPNSTLSARTLPRSESLPSVRRTPVSRARSTGNETSTCSVVSCAATRSPCSASRRLAYTACPSSSSNRTSPNWASVEPALPGHRGVDPRPTNRPVERREPAIRSRGLRQLSDVRQRDAVGLDARGRLALLRKIGGRREPSAHRPADRQLIDGQPTRVPPENRGLGEMPRIVPAYRPPGCRASR